MRPVVKRIILALLVMSMFFIVIDKSITVQADTNDTIVIGMEAAYAPFNWSTGTESENTQPLHGRSGYVDGYDVWLAKNISKKLGRKLIIKAMDWDGLIPALNSKEIDLIIAGMTETPERLQEVDFTNPYYKSNAVFVVSKNSKFANATNLTDFKDAKLAAQRGTLYVNLIKDFFDIETPFSLPTYGDLNLAVKSKKIDAFISEYPVAKGMVDADSRLKLVELTGSNGFGEAGEITVSIALRKKSKDLESTELIAKINELLVEIQPEMVQKMDEAISRQPKDENRSFFDKIGYILSEYGTMFLIGIGITLLLSIVGTLGGFLISMLLVIGRSQRIDKRRDSGFVRTIKKALHLLISGFSTVIRGTPMVVQAMIVFYGITASFWTPLVASLVVVVLNTSAYIAEAIKSGINGLDKGQLEAARSLGFSHNQAMFKVVLPQAIKNSLPSIGSEFVVNLKDTAIFSFIGVMDLFKVTNEAGAATFMIVESFVIAAVIYLIMTVVSSQLISYMERKNKRKEEFNHA